MKRIPIQLQEFLREFLAPAPLTWEEQRLLDRVLDDPYPSELERAARILVEGLIERGALTVLERSRVGGYETVLVRDPHRRIRARIRLPLRPPGPEARTIPLPLEWSARTGFRYHEVQGLLALQSTLVSSDRVMTPRDLVSRLERGLQELLPVGAAAFVPLEMPAGEDWPLPPAQNGIPVANDHLEALSRRRDHLVLLPDLGKDGSMLLLGLGDEESGWRGYLVLRHPEREHFTRERLALAQMVAHHFQGLIATSIRLQGLIFFDVLTGIYNRSFYELQIEREIAIANRRDQTLALLLVDVDDFRSFNSRYGYDGGDQVLATVADVLRTTLRTTDTLARYGGEEFTAILSPHIAIEEARIIAERLRAAVADEPLPIRGLDGKLVTEHVTVSIGGVLYPGGGRTHRELWNAANRLLLEAKARGKNQVRFVGDPV